METVAALARGLGVSLLVLLRTVEPVPEASEASGLSQNWGPMKLRLRDPQASPFGLTGLSLEEDVNDFPGRLELLPYHEKGSAVATLTAYLELEIEQQQMLLHNGSPILFTGAITSWPPAARIRC